MLRGIMRIITHFMRKSLARSDGREDAVLPLPQGVKADVDIPYIADGNHYHLLDFYAPKGRTALPVLIDVHGGGLFYGDKNINRRFGYALAREGFVVASVSYRLIPSVNFDSQVRDVTAAFRYVIAHAAEYGGDIGEIYLAGDSAGALLAYYGAAVSASPDMATAFEDELCPINPRGVLLVSGLYDLHAGGVLKHLRKYALGRKAHKKPWYKYTFFDNVLHEYVPPRAFLCTSYQDFLYTQTITARTAFTEYGCVCEVDVAPRRSDKGYKFDHIYPVRHPEWEESASLIKRAVKFLTDS